jgi:4'-phosphopantetheinyl transferase
MLAIRDPVEVHVWPDRVSRALDELRSERALTVISLVMPDTTLRHAARARVRTALQDVLGALLRRPAAAISLISQPGQAIFLDLPETRIGLSVSHAAGLTVAALRVGGAIGIDLIRTEPGAAELSDDWERVAQDYLGPHVCRRLVTLPPAQRAAAFAQAWTCQEAGLKCLGLGLTEWSPALESRLASCAVRALALLAPYDGAIAIGCGE